MATKFLGIRVRLPYGVLIVSIPLSLLFGQSDRTSVQPDQGSGDDHRYDSGIFAKGIYDLVFMFYAVR